MTISTEVRKAGPFVGNDSASAFPFAFKVFKAADLIVVRRQDNIGEETTLVLDSDYHVALNGNQDTTPGGVVTLVAGALASGFTLVVSSELPYLQPTDLTNQGGFYPKVITNALDRLTIFCQQLAEITGRTLKLPITAPTNISAEIPLPNPSELIAWDETGTRLTTVSPQSLVTSIAYGSATADLFAGDGVTTTFPLSTNPASVNNLDVSVGGFSQRPVQGGIGDYSWNGGASITFASPPPAPSTPGDKNVLVRYMQAIPVSDSEALHAQTREALRRSYAEAGYNLVDGSFEIGGTLASTSDVLLLESAGTAYAWTGVYPGGGYDVAPGSDPTVVPGFALKSLVALRSGLSEVDGANLVGGATYAQIRAYSGSATKIHCLGRANIFDGASGDFCLDATDTTSADAEGYILIDANGGRWKRQDNGEAINPVFCGADPSGVAVSTLAMQTAHDYANSLLKINQAAVGDLSRFAIKDVHYPHGVYKVDGKVNISGFSIITGDESRIESTNAADDIFSCGQINPSTGAYIDGAAYAVSIKGITFFGGRRHLVIANNNLDANQLHMEECSFFNSSSFSSDVVATSGQLTYKKCKWSGNHRIARLQNDMKEFSDCWFDCAKSTTANTDQIVNAGGTLYFYRCIGLPGTQNAAAWVADYQNHVQMYNCRFGDEGGNGGWPLIRAFGCQDASTRYSPAIVVRDCYTGGGLNSGRTDASLVYIDSPASDGIKRVPPIIIIDNVTKISSVVAIGTSLTEAEFNIASNLHAGLRYYSVDGVQTETYGMSSFLPVPIKQRALRRTDVDLKSPISGDATIFKHFISPQSLTNLNSVFKINYCGEVANNANTKALRLKMDGVTLPTATYIPAINSSKKFNGEITVQALNENSVLVSHKVVDTSGVAVVSIEYLGIRNFVNNEYALELSTQGGAVGDVTIVMLASEIKL